jgi:hypothetical protein
LVDVFLFNQFTVLRVWEQYSIFIIVNDVIMTDLIIKYAPDQVTGKPVFIRDAINGLACNCKSADTECEKKMIAPLTGRLPLNRFFRE